MRFIFRPGETCETLWARFQKAGRRGQIVGPHGTGKSTLVLEFTRFLAEQGIATHVFRWRPGSQGELMAAWRQGSIRPGEIVAIDGYDQLPLSDRLVWRFRLACRRVGLLATTHREAALPVLYRTEVDLWTARWVLRQILTAASAEAGVGGAGSLPSPAVANLTGVRAGSEPAAATPSEGENAPSCSDDELSRLLDRHGGNLREVLFELYDRYQDAAEG